MAAAVKGRGREGGTPPARRRRLFSGALCRKGLLPPPFSKPCKTPFFSVHSVNNATKREKSQGRTNPAARLHCRATEEKRRQRILLGIGRATTLRSAPHLGFFYLPSSIVGLGDLLEKRRREKIGDWRPPFVFPRSSLRLLGFCRRSDDMAGPSPRRLVTLLLPPTPTFFPRRQRSLIGSSVFLAPLRRLITRRSSFTGHRPSRLSASPFFPWQSGFYSFPRLLLL